VLLADTYPGMHIGFWWGSKKKRDNLTRWEDNIKMDLREKRWGD
jgi:hypothetical protein